MSEIKSTLDLIMEKTRHLTMDEEEKRTYKEKELAGKVKGLVQRRLDGLLTGEKFRQETGALFEESRDEKMVKRLLMDELTGRLEIGRNNEALLNILKTATGAEWNRVDEILRKYEKNAAFLRDSHEKVLRERLREKGITGEAAVPNLEADKKWRQALQRLREDMKAEMKTKAV